MNIYYESSQRMRKIPNKDDGSKIEPIYQTSSIKQKLTKANFLEKINENDTPIKSPSGWLNMYHQRNWNKPVREDVSNSKFSTTSDQQHSEPSRTLPDAPIPDQLQAHFATAQPAIEQPRSDQSRIEHTANDQASSRVSNRDDDSYFIPQHSTNSVPRMIQQGANGRAIPQNAFRRLRHMGSLEEDAEKLPTLPPPGDLGAHGYPSLKANSNKPIKKYPKSRDYQLTRCLCCWTTFFLIILALSAIGTCILAILKIGEKDCLGCCTSLIMLDMLILVILALEWIRMWIWREPTSSNRNKNGQFGSPKTLGTPPNGMSAHTNTAALPPMTAQPSMMRGTYDEYSGVRGPRDEEGGFLSSGFQQRFYDVPQFISALCLIVLYFIAITCTCVTVGVAIQSKTTCKKVAPTALGFSAFLIVLLIVRIVMFCLSDACYGLCYRTAMATTSKDANVPMVAVNQLHEVLPGLGKQFHANNEGSNSNGLPNAWLTNLATSSDPSQHLSIIQPMPAKFSGDFTK